MKTTPRSVLSIVGIGTLLSLFYSALSYGIQISLVELFGYKLRGVFEILMSVIGLASVLFSFNYYTALNLHVARSHGAPTNIASIGNLVLSVQLIALITLYFLIPKNGMVEAGQNWLYLGLLAFAATLNHKVNEKTALLNGHHRFLQAKVLSLVGAGFSALLILIAYLCGHKEVGLIVWLAVIGPFAGSYLYAKALIRRKHELRFEKGSMAPSSLLKENGGVYLISLAQFISIKVYLLYIAQQESVETLGIFSLAYSITQFVLLPATLLATIVISSRSDESAGMTGSMRGLIAYGAAAAIFAKLSIDHGVLLWLPFKSFHNETFADMLSIMVLSVPFNILNILTVAIAIRQRQCSRYFIGAQIALLPAFLSCYMALRYLHWSVASVSLSYVLTWALVSLAAFAVVQRTRRLTRTPSCIPFQ